MSVMQVLLCQGQCLAYAEHPRSLLQHAMQHVGWGPEGDECKGVEGFTSMTTCS